MALYVLAANCNYGEMEAEIICDRLVVGIWDTSLFECLQLDADFTLEKAKKAIRQCGKLYMNSKIYLVQDSPLQWQLQEEPAVPWEPQLHHQHWERATETDHQAMLTLQKRAAHTRQVPGKGHNLPRAERRATTAYSIS